MTFTVGGLARSKFSDLRIQAFVDRSKSDSAVALYDAGCVWTIVAIEPGWVRVLAAERFLWVNETLLLPCELVP